MMGNMTVKLPCSRQYFGYFVFVNNHQYNCNITKSFLSVEEPEGKHGRDMCYVEGGQHGRITSYSP